MNPIRIELDRYLAFRRARGFKLDEVSAHLYEFMDFMERHDEDVLMVGSGVGIETISLYLGHEDIRTTARYLHHNLNIKIRAMNRTKFPTLTEPGKDEKVGKFQLSNADRELLKKLKV